MNIIRKPSETCLNCIHSIKSDELQDKYQYICEIDEAIIGFIGFADGFDTDLFETTCNMWEKY
jgi:hypothetical protein